MQAIYLSLLSLPLLATLAQADVSFNSTVPPYDFDGRIPASGLSRACAAAYAAPVKCTSHLFKLRDSENGVKLFTNTELSRFCTDECVDSLNEWDTNLQGSCSSADRRVVRNPTGVAVYLGMALEGRHSVQENLYWAFCLQDEKSGRKDDFCLAKADKLPEWPPTTASGGSGTGVVAEFCKSSCRTQQSYLMHRSATHLGVNSINLPDAEKICPGLDVSTFPISVKMLDAFGSSAETSPGNSTSASSSSSLIEGTEHKWDFYRSGFGSGNAGSSVAAGLQPMLVWGMGLAAVGLLSL